MKKFLFLSILASALVSSLTAGPAESQRFLADDQGLWHLEDNPTLIATSAGLDGLMLGVSYDAMDASGAAVQAGAFGDVKAACLLPLLGYNAITFRADSFDLVSGSAFSLGPSLSDTNSAGFRLRIPSRTRSGCCCDRSASSPSDSRGESSFRAAWRAAWASPSAHSPWAATPVLSPAPSASTPTCPCPRPAASPSTISGPASCFRISRTCAPGTPPLQATSAGRSAMGA